MPLENRAGSKLISGQFPGSLISSITRHPGNGCGGSFSESNNSSCRENYWKSSRGTVWSSISPPTTRTLGYQLASIHRFLRQLKNKTRSSSLQSLDWGKVLLATSI